jgi:triphosphoribosyl-dephospho-CoA synthase
VIDHHFYLACRSAIEALKPGHVPVDDDGREISVAEFLRAAAAAAPEIAAPGARLGARLLGVARATQAAMGRSVGAHIAVICAPLAMAGERRGRLHRNVHAVLAEAGVQELDDAMRTIGARDNVARLFAEDFATLFHRALPPFLRTLQRRQSKPVAAVECYLRWLALWPDSEIVDRYGKQAGAAVQTKARDLLALMERTRTIEATLPLLHDWDAELKALHLSPGSSATLTTGTLFAWHLRSMQERDDADDDGLGELDLTTALEKIRAG